MRGAAAWCNVYLALGHRHDGSTGNWVRETEQRMSRTEHRAKNEESLREQSVGEQDRGWCKSKSRHKVLHAVQTQMTIDQHVLYQCIIGEWPKSANFIQLWQISGFSQAHGLGLKFCSIAVQCSGELDALGTTPSKSLLWWWWANLYFNHSLLSRLQTFLLCRVKIIEFYRQLQTFL